ncbi:hypothetical protein [Chromobacterium sp. Beijing]|uniref:hypothetical protein n=1 Tax=Chromobacterium sp. Beijing TaxID=2735795 RepID=UPI001F2A9E91|nr:hypothetical protein [Chromobacterium sp. Beijing]UJB30812.1 hypothetical protein HQN78_06935 [Chromobacterium sp. Beijing]
MVALSLHTEKTFTVVEVTGGKKAFRSMLIRQLTKASGKALNPREMERAVSAQLRRLKAAGVPLDNTEKKRFLLLVDTEQASSLPKGLKTPEQAKWLANSIKTPEELEKINFSNWRSRVGNPAVAIAKGSVPYISGLVTGLLQYNAMQKLIEDEGKAMSHEAKEAYGRLRAGVIALAATSTDLIAQGLAKIAPQFARFARGLNLTSLALTWIGRAAGVLGALIMAAWDIEQMKKANANGNVGLAFLYGGSALIGLTLTVALLLGFNFIGLLLVIAFIGIAILIEYFKNNKVQDWLERCLWGKGKSAHYQNETEELQQLKLATN